MNRSDKTNKIIKICIFLAVATCSFDIFANVTFLGFNFRFCQFILFPVIFLMILRIVKNRKAELYLGMRYLLVWLAFQILFIGMSPDLGNAVAYTLWLIFNILTVYLIVYYSDRVFTLEEFMRFYMDSFFAMAVLGFLQMILYFCGISFYVTQKWNHYLCRINGFTFEPSYYATYMLIGFVMYAYLLEKKNENIMKRRTMKIKFFIITTAMVLASSRMGWLLMLLWLAIRCINRVYYEIRRGLPIQRILHLCLAMGIGVLGFLLIWVWLFKDGPLSFMLNGLGLYGQPAHSVSSRLSGLCKDMQVFWEHPWLGVSLGGVAPAIAQYNGVTYDSSHNGGSMILPGELLVANGIIGMVPFLLYIGSLLLESRWWRQDFEKYPLCDVYRAVEWAFIFELIILCLNQNILRMYVWIHIGILCALHKKWKESTEA